VFALPWNKVLWKFVPHQDLVQFMLTCRAAYEELQTGALLDENELPLILRQEVRVGEGRFERSDSGYYRHQAQRSSESQFYFLVQTVKY